MSLSAEIRTWDGKSITLMERIYLEYSAQKMFASDLIFFAADLALQRGATWLLKKFIESGNFVDSENLANLFKNLDKLHDEHSKLHVLQCLPFVEPPAVAKDRLEYFLHSCLPHEDMDFRLYVYSGFYLLALNFPELQEKISKLLHHFIPKESTAIQMQLRALVEKDF